MKKEGNVIYRCNTCDYSIMCIHNFEMDNPLRKTDLSIRICHACLGTKVYMDQGEDVCPVCGIASRNIGQGDTCPKCSKGILTVIEEYYGPVRVCGIH